MIADSVRLPRQHVEEVVFDAEHFFDGFKRDREYALKTLRAAERAGASCLVLCDTNGGSCRRRSPRSSRETRRPSGPARHPRHNDGECAVANSLAAVVEGAEQVQGTINGFGERCGNANLVLDHPEPHAEAGLRRVPEVQLRELRDVARFVFELANREPGRASRTSATRRSRTRPACTSSAVLKHPETYEHIDARPRRQPPARAGVRARREVEHPLQGARVRHRSRRRTPRRRAASWTS